MPGLDPGIHRKQGSKRGERSPHERSDMRGAGEPACRYNEKAALYPVGQVGMSISGVIEDGMAQMSAKFKAMGSSVYLDADKVKESNKALS